MTGASTDIEPDDLSAERHAASRAQGRAAESPANRKLLLELLLWFAVAVVVGGLSFQVELDISGDNAEYLVLAKSLANGDGYQRVSLPDPPPTETQRPIGYPGLLAGLILLFGDRLWVLKAAPLVAFGLAAAGAWYLLRDEERERGLVVVGALILFVFNLNSTRYASICGTETLFTLCGILVLIAVEQAACRTSSAMWGWAALAGLLTAYACYVRPNGVAIVPAVFLYLGLRKRWGPALVASGIAVVALAPWLWQQQQFTAQGNKTYMRYAIADTGGKEANWQTRLGKLSQRVRINAMAHWLSAGQMLLAKPASFSLRPRPLGARGGLVEEDSGPSEEMEAGAAAPEQAREPLSLKRLARRGSRYLIGLLVLVGAVVTWRRRGSAIHWYCLFTLLMLLVIPFPRGRYLFSLLPFMAWFFLAAILWMGEGAERLLGETGPGLAKALVVGACALAVILTAVGVAQRVDLNLRHRGEPWWSPERYELTGADVVNYVKACLWIRDNTPADAVVACRKPYQLYLYSGRRGTWDPLMGSVDKPDRTWASITRFQEFGPVYVIEDAFGERFGGAHTRDLLAPVLQAHAAALPEVATFEQPRTRVFRLVGGDRHG